MQLNDVAFRYHRRSPWVLRNVTLSFPPGSVTEVTGRNGAGKSTLLRLLAGIRRPCRGTIEDRPARVGYAPERFPMEQSFTVGGYLSHMAAIRGVPDTTITTWAERLAFGDLLTVRLPDLSKGSAQKVGLAQALIADPALLILDEPFAGLDRTTRAGLPALLTELASHGTTVVVSDHQRCLEAVPDMSRLHVADASVTPRPGNAWTVLEVLVPADEAAKAETDLRAAGYRVRSPRRTDRHI